MDEANVFSRLFRCARGNQENFLTEALCVVLDCLRQYEPPIAADIVRKITDFDVSADDVRAVSLSTQFWTPHGTPDVAVQLGNQLAFIEVKDEACFADDQTERYRRVLDASEAGRTQLITLTRYFSESTRHSDCVDRCFQWNDIAHWLESATSDTPRSDSVAAYLTNQFIEFLRERGLVMESVGSELVPGMQSFGRIAKMMQEAAERCGLQKQWVVDVKYGWLGYYIEGSRFNFGINLTDPSALAFHTYLFEIDPTRIDDSIRDGIYKKDERRIPGELRWGAYLDFVADDGAFFRLTKSEQLARIVEFLTASLATARSIERTAASGESS